jgi:hypothetical protein
MHSEDVRQQAAHLAERGVSLSEASRLLGVSRATLRGWRTEPTAGALLRRCSRCDGADLDRASYAALLGYYLGDGHVSRMPRYHALRISCDATYPGIVDDVERTIRLVHPSRPAFRVRAPGVIVVQSHWKHWPCLFPQHGPGRKHERPIVLEDWQEQIVAAHPADFLRGLFHSDGSRVKNWTSRLVAGEPKRYDYPRWQFTNSSADIRALCCWALDLAGVAWRQSNHQTISVSRRADVARLDALIGLKS